MEAATTLFKTYQPVKQLHFELVVKTNLHALNGNVITAQTLSSTSL